MNWKIVISAILALTVLIVIMLVVINVAQTTYSDTDSATSDWSNQIAECVDGVNCFSSAEKNQPRGRNNLITHTALILNGCYNSTIVCGGVL